MRARLTREAVVWLVLLTATVLNWSMTDVAGAAGPGHLLGAVILVIAFVKTWLVIDTFMEAREAPTPLRLGLAAWATVACGGLLFQLLA